MRRLRVYFPGPVNELQDLMALRERYQTRVYCFLERCSKAGAGV